MNAETAATVPRPSIRGRRAPRFGRYLGGKVLGAIVLLWTCCTLVFFLTHAASGNIARSLLGASATPAEVAQKAQQLGLNRPLLSQYFDWLGGAVHGDLGNSWLSDGPVMNAVTARLSPTLTIVIASIIVTGILAIGLGITAARYGGWMDRGLQIFLVLGLAIPGFWLALILVTEFAINIQIFPATGLVPFSNSPGDWVRSLVLPVVSLSVSAICGVAMQIRGGMRDVMDADFMRTLRSRGLPTHRVILLHGFRAVAPAALSVLSLQLVGMLGGVVLVERIFALNGIGAYAVQAATSGDVPAVMGVVVVMVVLVAGVNLLVDLTHAWLDPKVREG